MNLSRQDIWIVLASAVPLLLIFVLPLLGYSDAGAVVGFVFFLFAGHMVLLGFHGSKRAHRAHHGQGGTA